MPVRKRKKKKSPKTFRSGCCGQATASALSRSRPFGETIGHFVSNHPAGPYFC